MEFEIGSVQDFSDMCKEMGGEVLLKEDGDEFSAICKLPSEKEFDYIDVDDYQDIVLYKISSGERHKITLHGDVDAVMYWGSGVRGVGVYYYWRSGGIRLAEAGPVRVAGFGYERFVDFPKAFTGSKYSLTFEILDKEALNEKLESYG